MTIPAIHYREGSRDNFGKLRVVHLNDLKTVETQLVVSEKKADYCMRLGWRRGVPPLRGEVISLHLPQSRILVRVSRVTRSCVCCPHGVVYIHARAVPNIVPDARPCDCAKNREMRPQVEWRELSREVECRKKPRAFLQEVSRVLNERRNA